MSHFGRRIIWDLGGLGVISVIVLIVHGICTPRAEKAIEAEGLVKLSKKRAAGKGEYWRDLSCRTARGRR